MSGAQDPVLEPLDRTHRVFNQTPALEDFNLYEGDVPLCEGVRREGAVWAEAELRAHGARCGSAEVIEWGFLANRHKPELLTHDRQGHRIDRVRYHPAYHELMRLGLEAGLHCRVWTEPRPGAQVARAAACYLQGQVEAGHCCPLTMTFAAVPVLRGTPAIAEHWLPGVLVRGYDPRDLPAAEKRALTIGMGMTEKQGGSDVRANTTSAQPLDSGGSGAAYCLVGHKWFMSAPMCDAFLMLAQAPGGLSCFLVPRWQPDGSRNGIRLQRLKDKLGNVANASSEVELQGALGWMLGEEGRGVATILEMVALTRFDCIVNSAAAQRQAVAQAVHHAAHRSAFGAALIHQPLMRNVLADLQLEVEGSLALALRLARALDHPDDEAERLLLRLGLPVGKYWVCKRTPGHVYEALECLGGNGVVEEFIAARLYRDAPINAIWEGSGNIQALDVLRVLEREPAAVDAWFAELELTAGAEPLLDAAVAGLKAGLTAADREYRARALVGQLALTLQASLLVRAGQGAVAEAFIRARLGGGGHLYGDLPAGVNVKVLLERGRPRPV
ncbi:MAG: isovaleryl-CoA dehydrogenase [Pseudomonadota bacterium]